MQEKLKVRRLILENIRGFPRLDLELAATTGVRNWAVFLGDNGAGKSTILRSLALALGDRSHAAGLLQDFNGNLVRKNSPGATGHIRVEFAPFATEAFAPFIDIWVTNRGDREEITDYKTHPENFHWDRIFVAGYGAGRGVEGTESWSKYRASDAVYSLFQYSQPLQNSELVLRRITQKEDDQSRYLQIIDEVMMLPLGSTRLSKAGIVVKGPWGEELPLSALGDGYRATLAWVTDLMGWAMFISKSAPAPSEMSGIILIDELDQHLHPVWQRRIIRVLSERFPKLQFFVTTHSPTTTLGTTDLADELCQIWSIYFDEDKQAATIQSEAPRGKRVDQILTSALFGMFDTWDDGTQGKILRYAELARDPDTGSKRAEIEKLREILSERLGSGGSELEIVVKRAVRGAIDQHFQDKLNSEGMKLLKEAAEFEGLRQLADLDPSPEDSDE